MNKNTTALLLLSLSLSLPVIAKELTPTEALGRVKTEAGLAMVRRVGKISPTLVHTTKSLDGSPAIYIFNNNDGKGFMAVSADDVATPILGYSDNGAFTTENIPPQLEWWLSEYARQIEYARSKGIGTYSSSKRTFSRSGEREAIAPLVKTMWDQIDPFNDQCPLDGTDRTWTGCVATSMAQVMNYWKYPEKGQGQITYSIESLEKKVTLDFSKKKFDWGNMLDTYRAGQYDETQSQAVAYLMKACGYSVKMQYSMDASGALAMNIGNALKKYFNYDGNLLYTLREYYSSTQWEEMVYENLKNVGPVLYGGGSTLGGGHSFVCDGYDGNGMFHFNWGWSGMSDGYFSLDALNPDALGTGGGSGGGYNFTQDAVFGIQPPTGEPVETHPLFLTQEGELSGKISGNVLSLSLTNSGEPMWINYNPTSMYIKFGAMFYPQGDTEGEAIYHDISDKRFELLPGYGTNTTVLKPMVSLRTLNLQNGTYKVVVGTVEVPKGTTSESTDGEGFVEIKPQYGSANYVTLNVKDGRYTVVNDLLPALKVKGELIGELYYGCLTRVKVTVENTSDIERISGFAPVFLDSQGPLLLGESILLTIPPHSTVTKEWSTDLTQMVQFMDPYFGIPLTFTFFNEIDFDFYLNEFQGVAELHENPGKPTVQVTRDLAITNANLEDECYMIPNALDFEVTAKLRLIRGYFSYPVLACLCVPYNSQQIEIATTTGQNVFLSTESDEARTLEFAARMSYPVYDPDQLYYVALAYSGASGLVTLSKMLPVKFTGFGGIDTIGEMPEFYTVTDRETGTVTITAPAALVSVEAYDLTGNRNNLNTVYEGNRAVVKLAKQGITILRATDAEGNTRTFKLR